MNSKNKLIEIIDEKKADELYSKKESFSKGKRGLISFAVDDKGKKYCIKEKNPTSDATNRIYIEFVNNKKLNEINIGPQIYFYDNKKDFLIRDFIKGENIFDFIKIHSTEEKFIENLSKIIIDVLEQCLRMDKIKINKLEMTNPHKDLIIDDSYKPWLIDFERCRFSTRPKNVTQFCQFLTKGNMREQLEKLKIFLDKEKILHLAEEYKKKQSEEQFLQIKKALKEKLI